MHCHEWRYNSLNNTWLRNFKLITYFYKEFFTFSMVNSFEYNQNLRFAKISKQIDNFWQFFWHTR